MITACPFEYNKKVGDLVYEGTNCAVHWSLGWVNNRPHGFAFKLKLHTIAATVGVHKGGELLKTEHVVFDLNDEAVSCDQIRIFPGYSLDIRRIKVNDAGAPLRVWVEWSIRS
jgi:hypothetical protein